MNEKYERRAELLKNGKFHTFKAVKKQAWKNQEDIKTYEINDYGEVIGQKWDEELFGMSQEEVQDCFRMSENRKKQRQNVQEHLEWLSDRGYFLAFVTFNFDEKALQLKKETRKKRVVALCTRFDDFILNIDYGEKSDREHYHAIIALKEGDFIDYRNESGHAKNHILDGYNLGFYDLELVRMEGNYREKLANYLAKLTSHSMKVQQQYISTKKGTEYQEQKKATRKKKKAWNRHLKRVNDR